MNKTCQYTKNDIWDYYSGKLSRQQETDMQEHIISCDWCLHELEKLEGLAEALSEDIEDEDEVVDTAPTLPLPQIDGDTVSPLTPKKKDRTALVIAIIAIAAALALIVYLILPKEELSYPIHKDDQDVFGPGDSVKVDSSYIKSIKIDSVQIDDKNVK
ncbi:MAG: hypothetical protein ACK5KT_11730 [Dysgonomonas sp.]